jgi:hypothetical protein
MRRLILGFSTKRAVIVVVTIGIALASLRSNVAADKKGSVDLPGEWSLAILPSLRAQPIVDAYSVTTDASKGLTAGQVGVRNRSSKNVVGVKLGWRLFLDGEPDTTLRQGETPLLGVPVAPKERRVVEFPVVVANRILSTLIKGGSLKGRFRIEVMVTDTLFDEGSSTRAQPSGGLASHALISRASWRSPDVTIPVPNHIDLSIMEACQNQACAWQNGGCYACTESQGFGCTMQGGCNTCCNSKCAGELDG